MVKLFAIKNSEGRKAYNLLQNEVDEAEKSGNVNSLIRVLEQVKTNLKNATSSGQDGRLYLLSKANVQYYLGGCYRIRAGQDDLSKTIENFKEALHTYKSLAPFMDFIDDDGFKLDVAKHILSSRCLISNELAEIYKKLGDKASAHQYFQETKEFLEDAKRIFAALPEDLRAIDVQLAGNILSTAQRQ